ncbi:hypothetical protein QQY66_46540 [Streptomyces sp. DG2A-72]|nr:hypothetical protein [Streptomyces sp. DG2A-72]MDO0938821.1 hypothetical protein [Streptomyces sp. DG2A-72]
MGSLEGALDEIARRGGGTVESYPEDTADGEHHWVVTKAVS